MNAFVIWVFATAWINVTALKTIVVTYEDSSCSSPATSVKLTSLLTCSPQANHFEPICESGGTAFSVSDCINYRRGGWDDLGILSDVLSKSTYLTVETYVAGRCGQWDSVSNVAIYRLDENCYPNAAGTESHQLTLGHSVTITKYSDATCSNVATTTTVQEAVLGASHVGVCVDDMTGFITGTMPDLNFVANYDDDTCSNTPNRLTFTQDFACKFTTDSPCQSNGVSRFTVAGCAKDFSAKAAEVFGANSPYVIVADYPNQWCNDVEYVTVYSADGLCHANEDDGTSFKAFITAEGTATILLYSDKACMDMVSNTNVDTNTLSSSLCMYRSCNFWFGCGTRYSVGGLGAPISMGKKTAVVTYEDSSCLLTPIQVDVTDDGTSELGCTMTSAPQCTTMVGEGSTLYQSRECINDTEAFAESKYWKIPFLVVENYVNDTNCQVRKSISMYAADGKCHFRMSDGKYYTITQFMGDVTIRTYPTSSCKEIESSAFTIDLWQVNTGWCVKGQKFYTSKESIAKPQVPDPLTPSTSAPQTWTPSPTTSAPQTWTPSPTSAPQTCTCAPSPTTPAPDIVTVKDDIDARLSIMFPAWLWDPSPPRVFMSDGRHQKHHHQRYP